MKKGIHPKYHSIKVVMTDGFEYETRSTWGKEGSVMNLPVDSKSHPAYTGQRRSNLSAEGRIAKFNQRYNRG